MGEIALVTGETRSSSVIAKSTTRVWMLYKEDFDNAISVSAKMAKAFKDIVNERIKNLQNLDAISTDMADNWVKKASKNIDSKITLPTDEEIHEAASEHSLRGLLPQLPGDLCARHQELRSLWRPARAPGHSDAPANPAGRGIRADASGRDIRAWQ